jgi:predicted DNA repair protein MutK
MFSFSYVEMRIVALSIIHLCLGCNLVFPKILERIVALSIIHLCQKGLEKKMHAKEHEEKRRKRKKERKKDSPYFQLKGICSKRERFMIKGVLKIFRSRNIIKIPHTCTS